jgi:hypothetical protein
MPHHSCDAIRANWNTIIPKQTFLKLSIHFSENISTSCSCFQLSTKYKLLNYIGFFNESQKRDWVFPDMSVFSFSWKLNFLFVCNFPRKVHIMSPSFVVLTSWACIHSQTDAFEMLWQHRPVWLNIRIFVCIVPLYVSVSCDHLQKAITTC